MGLADTCKRFRAARNLAKSGIAQLVSRFDFISNPRNIGTVAAFDIDLPGDRALFKLSQRGFEHLNHSPSWQYNLFIFTINSGYQQNVKIC